MSNMKSRHLAFHVDETRRDLRKKCDDVAMVTINGHKAYDCASELSLFYLQRAAREMIFEGQSFLHTYRRKLDVGDQISEMDPDCLLDVREIAEAFIGTMQSAQYKRDIRRFNDAYDKFLKYGRALRRADYELGNNG